jgi:hypothetical protein
MLACSVFCKAAPVGVLLGGTGVHRNVMQRAPQVSALLSASWDRRQYADADPAISVTACAEADHVD